MEISVVIPVFNGESFIKDSVENLRSFLDKYFSSYEIIVVDDGSTDNTRAILESLHEKNLRILGLEHNTGKYGAIAAGMAASCGTCRVFTDADIPYDQEAILYIAKLINERQVHVVIGDRTLPESEYFSHLSFIRNLATKIFSFFIAIFVTGGLFDTQCGLKGFRSDVADVLFPFLREKGFVGDVEILYISLKYNLEIKRIPVRLKRTGPSSVQLFPQALKMLWRIVMLRQNWRRGLYDSEELTRISSQAYWKKSLVKKTLSK
jgi:dolichyl-phosphate beta-glucosyltransferase